jgi:hypothetical protein
VWVGDSHKEQSIKTKIRTVGVNIHNIWKLQSAQISNIIQIMQYSLI